MDKKYADISVVHHTEALCRGDIYIMLQRLRAAGAFLTTSESVVFELLGDSKHASFKEVQVLVKTSAPDSGLLTKL